MSNRSKIEYCAQELAKTKRSNSHSNRCLVYDASAHISDCDCWVLAQARITVEIVLRAHEEFSLSHYH